MRNLHEIDPERTEWDNAFIWWLSRYRVSGLLEYYDDYYSGNERWRPLRPYAESDQKYVIARWKENGSPIVHVDRI